MDFLKQLEWRYATKTFDRSEQISPSDMHTLLESLRLAPSAYGLQPWSFVIVRDPALRAQLRKVSYNQEQVTDASHFVVLCVKTNVDTAYIDRYIAYMAQQRGKTTESLAGFRTMIVDDVSGRSTKSVQDWSKNQVYLALGFLLSTAAYMGIDACPLEGFKPKSYERVLGLAAKGLKPVVCAALGYRDVSDKTIARKKVRFPASDLIIEV